MRLKYQRKTLQERFQVESYTPPPEAINAARERTRDILTAWFHQGARYDTLESLAESCYLQGVNDSAASLARMGYRIVKVDE